MTEGRPDRRSRRGHASWTVIIIAAVFCATVAGVAGYVVVSYAGRQAELDAIVEEGMLTFSINATPVMEDGKAEANLLIENPPDNGNRFTVTISREDTGEVIYQSGYLDPEQYIEKARLDVELPAGEYGCLASFDAYRIRDNAYIGRAAARLTLYVQQ